MNTSPNFEFLLPEDSDLVDVNVFNNNNGKIDSILSIYATPLISNLAGTTDIATFIATKHFYPVSDVVYAKINPISDMTGTFTIDGTVVTTIGSLVKPKDTVRIDTITVVGDKKNITFSIMQNFDNLQDREDQYYISDNIGGPGKDILCDYGISPAMHRSYTVDTVDMINHTATLIDFPHNLNFGTTIPISLSTGDKVMPCAFNDALGILCKIVYKANANRIYYDNSNSGLNKVINVQSAIDTLDNKVKDLTLFKINAMDIKKTLQDSVIHDKKALEELKKIFDHHGNAEELFGNNINAILCFLRTDVVSYAKLSGFTYDRTNNFLELMFIFIDLKFGAYSFKLTTNGTNGLDWSYQENKSSLSNITQNNI